MKTLRIFAVLCLLGWTAQAASFRVECDLTVTNLPAVSNTFTLNSQTRTWTNNTLASTNFIIMTNDLGWTATNLQQNLALNPLTNVVQVDVLSSNSIRIYGAVDYYLTVSLAAGWATNILRTNTLYNSAAVWMPYPTN
ncbi:MAG: hypothetical protein V2A79_08070, partial [Planctomycetota bacterium]